MCLSTFGEKKRCWLEAGPCHLGLLNICSVLWTFRNNYVVDFVKEAMIGKNVSITSGSKTSWQAGRSGEQLSWQTWWPFSFLTVALAPWASLHSPAEGQGHVCHFKILPSLWDFGLFCGYWLPFPRDSQDSRTITVVSLRMFEYHFYAVTQLHSLFLFSCSEQMLWSHLLSRPVE